MEEYQVNVYVPVTKDYKVNRLTIRNVKYTGDCSGLAYWYYTNNPNSNNIIIHILFKNIFKDILNYSILLHISDISNIFDKSSD